MLRREREREGGERERENAARKCFFFTRKSSAAQLRALAKSFTYRKYSREAVSTETPVRAAATSKSKLHSGSDKLSLIYESIPYT